MTHWLFVIPLGMGLASGYYTLRSSDELNNSLIGVFTLICLLISLLTAPWELQLLIALLVMAAARYYWLQLDAKADDSVSATSANTQWEKPSTSLEEAGTGRTYRGVAYEVDSNLSSVQDPKPIAKAESSQRTYRGVAYDNVEELVYALEKLADSPADPPKKTLKYRGISLSANSLEEPESNP